MNVHEIGKQLVGHCRNNTERQALEELYHKDAVSIEAVPNPETGIREVKGIGELVAKHEWWSNNMEVTGGEVIGPMPHGEDRFAVIFRVQGKELASGQAFDMQEVAVYHVDNGKIVREEFFYTV